MSGRFSRGGRPERVGRVEGRVAGTYTVAYYKSNKGTPGGGQLVQRLESDWTLETALRMAAS